MTAIDIDLGLISFSFVFWWYLLLNGSDGILLLLFIIIFLSLSLFFVFHLLCRLLMVSALEYLVAALLRLPRLPVLLCVCPNKMISM